MEGKSKSVDEVDGYRKAGEQETLEWLGELDGGGGVWIRGVKGG